MSKGSSTKTSVEIPPFQKPDVPSFSLPGYGQTTFADNTYGFESDPQQAAYQQQLKTLRSSILSGLGITSPERQASLNQWQDTFTNEALRTSMPQLEQTLFSRGLGGSEFYKGAVTDLLSKVASQSVLGREQLSQQDEYLKLSQLASIAGLDQQDFANMFNLIGNSANLGVSEESLAQQRYLATLPYTARLNQSNSGLGGALSGAAQGAQYGSAFGPWGTAIGAGIGGVTGYAGSRGSTSTPYALELAKAGKDGGSNDMSWLQYLQYLQPVKGVNP